MATGLSLAACAPAPPGPSNVAARALADQQLDVHWAFEHRGSPPVAPKPSAEEAEPSVPEESPEDIALTRVCRRHGAEPGMYLLAAAAEPFLPLLEPSVAKFAKENPDAVLVVRRGPRPKTLVRSTIVLHALGATAVEFPPDAALPGVHFEAVRLPPGASKGYVFVRTCPEGGCGPTDLPVVSMDPPAKATKPWLYCRISQWWKGGRSVFLRGEADRVALLPRFSGPLAAPTLLFSTRMEAGDFEAQVTPPKPIGGPTLITLVPHKGCLPRPAPRLETLPLGPSVYEVRVYGYPSACDPV